MTDILDVRDLEPKKRHESIFDTYNCLGPGEGFILVNDHEPKPLLYQFQAEHDGEFDWWPLEKGPEVWRVLVEKRTTFNPAISMTDYMQSDHSRLDKILVDVVRCVGTGDWDEALSVFKSFDLGLRRHISVEEEAFFPIFEEKTGMKGAGPTVIMEMEHGEIKEYMDRALISIKDKNAENAKSNLDALITYLSDHNMKEEHVLYPELDHFVNDSERHEAIKKAQTF